MSSVFPVFAFEMFGHIEHKLRNEYGVKAVLCEFCAQPKSGTRALSPMPHPFAPGALHKSRQRGRKIAIDL